MKLTYRGISYETTDMTVPTIATAMTVTYRGQTYKIQQLALNFPIQHSAGIIYHMSSGSCFNVTFLGRRYHHCPLVIHEI